MNPTCPVQWRTSNEGEGTWRTCDSPVGEAWSCSACAEKLRIALGDVNSLWEDLDAVLALQARYSSPEGRGGELALPFNPAASEIGWVLRNTLNTWCKLVAEERVWDLPEDHPAKVAGWLLGQVEWIRQQRAGHQAIEEITSAVNAVRKAVDRPAERLYAGPCKECGTDLYGKPGAAEVTCKTCKTVSAVVEQKTWMGAIIETRLITGREASVLLAWAGMEIQQATIKKWQQRDLLEAHSKDANGAWLYRWPEVKALAEEHTKAQQEAS